MSKFSFFNISYYFWFYVVGDGLRMQSNITPIQAMCAINANWGGNLGRTSAPTQKTILKLKVKFETKPYQSA